MRFVLIALLFIAGSCSEREQDISRPGGPFSSADLFAQEYVVITLEFSAGGIKPVPSGADLIRGPEKTNSAIMDLWVIPSAEGTEIGRYAMPDPRLQKREFGGWEIAEVAETQIFVPLSPDIDNVEIKPVDGREHIASKGGSFNPLGAAALACSDPPHEFPTCAEIRARILLLGAPD